MKESKFIEQNKEKWLEAEDILTSKQKDTDKLSSLFVQLVDDLSYARTFFAHRYITVYLNQVATKFSALIYTRKRSKWSSFVSFWKEELPQIVLYCRYELLISLLVFLLAVAIGVVSSANDPDFAASILGESYIRMTKEYINSGDPMAVYKSSASGEMFLQITMNNVYVSFLVYMSGLVFGLGTLSLLLYNGIMVGTFQYFFYQHGLLGESMLAIWLHGTLEISSIIIAAGAGLTLARGIVLPGTYTRTQAFFIAASRSVKLLLGTIPIFIFAAFVESFLTRYTEVPGLIRLAFILISLCFVVGYFIVYPKLKSRRGFSEPVVDAKIAITQREATVFTTIKTNAEVFQDAFRLFQKLFVRLLVPAVIAGAIIAVANYKLEPPADFSVETFAAFIASLFQRVFRFYTYSNTQYLAICIPVLAVLLFTVNHMLFKVVPGNKPNGAVYYISGLVNALVVSAGINYFLYAGSGVAVLLLGIFIPYFLLLNYSAHHKQVLLPSAVGPFFKMTIEMFGRTLGLFLLLMTVTVTFSLVTTSPLYWVYYRALQMNLPPDLQYLQKALEILTIVIQATCSLLVLCFDVICIMVLYYSGHEMQTAADLHKKLQLLKSSLTTNA